MENELSDTELRLQLEQQGVDVGPIVDTTRKLYVKRLQNLNTKKSKPRRSNVPERRTSRKSKSPARRTRRSTSSVSRDSKPDSEQATSVSDGKASSPKKTLPTSAIIPGRKSMRYEQQPQDQSPFTGHTKQNVHAEDKDDSPIAKGKNQLYVGITPKLRSSVPQWLEDDVAPGKMVENTDSTSVWRHWMSKPMREIVEKNRKSLGVKDIRSSSIERQIDSSYSPDHSRVSNRRRTSRRSFGLNTSSHLLSSASDDGEISADYIPSKPKRQLFNFITKQHTTAFIVCLVIIFGGYLIFRSMKVATSPRTTELQKFICKEPGNDDCLAKDEVRRAVSDINLLRTILDEQAVEYYCNYPQLPSSMLSVTEACNRLSRVQSEVVSSVRWSNIARILLKMGKKYFSIVCYDDIDDFPLTSDSYHTQVAYLESVLVSIPLRCTAWYRLRCSLLYLQTYVHVVLKCLQVVWPITCGLTLLLIVLYSAYCLVRRRQRQHEARLAMLCTALDQTVRILRFRLNHSAVDGDLRASLRTIFPEFVDDKQWLNYRNYIANNCAQIRIENVRNSSMVRWQLEEEQQQQQHHYTKQMDFPSMDETNYRTMESCSSIPAEKCLKVHNFFSQQDLVSRSTAQLERQLMSEIGDLQSSVRRFDLRNGERGEACAYLQCSTVQTAGRIFTLLNGKFHNGRVVLVKFLPDDLYSRRFPLSAGTRASPSAGVSLF